MNYNCLLVGDVGEPGKPGDEGDIGESGDIGPPGMFSSEGIAMDKILVELRFMCNFNN